MTTWIKKPGGYSHTQATACVNIELPYDTYSDYHKVVPSYVIVSQIKGLFYHPIPSKKSVIF